MKHQRLNLISCLIIRLPLFSCGIMEQNHKKELADKLLKNQTLPGDEPYKPINRTYRDESLKKSITDTVLVVKNNDSYFQIDKYGNRVGVEFHYVRR